jgi:hypothetical protein
MRKLVSWVAVGQRREALLLALILLLMAALMMRQLNQSLLGHHSWRQADTASFARGLASGEFDLLHPTFLAYYPDQYGLGGATESEFNLYPLLVAGLFRLFGPRDALARLVSIAFGLGTGVMVYLIGRRVMDGAAGLLAALALCCSPLFLFYSRSVQPEATVLFFSVGALYFFLCWLESERWRDFVPAALCAALALLVKIPSLYIALPLVVAAWQKWRWQMWRRWQLWLYAGVVLLPAVAYYGHAHTLYQQTGLTVFGLSGGWPGSGKFAWLQLLTSKDFYYSIFNRLNTTILGRYGVLMVALSLVIAPGNSLRRKEEWVYYAWLAAVGVFILGVAQGNIQHEYYQLPIVPIAAMFIGRVGSLLLKLETLRLQLVFTRWPLGPLLVAVLMVLSLRSAIGNVSGMYGENKLLLEVAQVTQRLTPPEAPVAVLHDWPHVPEVFYYAQRKGWVLWIERTPEGEYGRLIIAERVKTPSGWEVREKLESDISRLDLLRAQGATHLVIALERSTSAVFNRSPIGMAIAARYRLVEGSEHWLVYDLR